MCNSFTNFFVCIYRHELMMRSCTLGNAKNSCKCCGVDTWAGMRVEWVCGDFLETFGGRFGSTALGSSRKKAKNTKHNQTSTCQPAPTLLHYDHEHKLGQGPYLCRQLPRIPRRASRRRPSTRDASDPRQSRRNLCPLQWQTSSLRLLCGSLQTNIHRLARPAHERNKLTSLPNPRILNP